MESLTYNENKMNLIQKNPNFYIIRIHCKKNHIIIGVKFPDSHLLLKIEKMFDKFIIYSAFDNTNHARADELC